MRYTYIAVPKFEIAKCTGTKLLLKKMVQKMKT